MIIDCDTCAVRGTGCADCVVTALLGPAAPGADPQPGPDLGPVSAPVVATAGPVELDEEEQRALAVLAGAGLVAPLRLAPGRPRPRGGRPGRDTPTRRRAV